MFSFQFKTFCQAICISNMSHFLNVNFANNAKNKCRIGWDSFGFYTHTHFFCIFISYKAFKYFVTDHPIYWQVLSKKRVQIPHESIDGQDSHRMQVLTTFPKNSENFSKFVEPWPISLQKARIHLRPAIYLQMPPMRQTFPFSHPTLCAQYIYILSIQSRQLTPECSNSTRSAFHRTCSYKSVRDASAISNSGARNSPLL